MARTVLAITRCVPRLRLGLPMVLVTCTLLWSCDSDDVLPPQVRHGVVVTVTTTGATPDADGYTVTLGSDQRTVGASGSVTFDNLVPGSYDVSLGGVAPNCAVVGGELRAVTVTAGQGATVSFEVACVFDAAGIALPETACPALSPSTLEGMPLAVVWIGNLPSNLDPDPIARVSWAGGPEVTFGFVDDQVDPATVMIPIHPSGAIEGGDVTIRIADDVQSCPPFTFRILPLPPAPGELAATFTLAEELIGVQALLFGTTVDDLLNLQVTEDDQALLPLAFAQTLVSDPANAYSLGAFANGSAPEFEPEDADMLDRLVARIGIRADMEAALGSIMSDEPVAPSPARAPLGLTQGLALNCVTSIDSAQLLHECMTLARDKAQGPASEVTQDKAIFAMEVAAMIPGPPRRFARPIAALLTYSKLYDQAVADNLPSEFVDITLSLNPPEFEEDQDGPGTWTPAQVRATSNGWNTEETLSELLGGFVNPRPIHRWTQKVRQVNWSANQTLQDRFDYADAYIADLLGHLLEPLIKQGLELGDDLLVLPPRTFGPVDVSDAEWTDARIVTGTSVVLTSHEAYDPREPGTSLLEVITAQGKFGGTSIRTDHLPIEVTPLDLDFFRDDDPVHQIHVQPSEVVELVLRVENAMYPDRVEFDALPESHGAFEVQQTAATEYRVTYTAPQNTSSLPALLVARHTSETGARAHASTPVVAIVEIRGSALTISPGFQCLNPTDPPLQFMATVSGDPNVEVGWTASVGNISSAGLYDPAGVAPGTTVEIRATSTTDPGLSGTVTIQVGNCVCGFTVSVGNQPTLVGQPGDSVGYFLPYEVVPGEPNAILAVILWDAEGSSAWFSVHIPTTVVAGPGSFTLRSVDGGLGYGGLFDLYGTTRPETGNAGTLLIYQYEPHTALVGEVIGGIARHDADNNEPNMTVSATFSIYPPPGPQYGFVYVCTIAGP